MNRFIKWLIALAVPVLLVIGSARLVMSPLFLQLEYTRPGFPPDVYGFSVEDRLEYGPYGVLYILNGEGIDYLGDLQLPGERCYPPQRQPCAMFNDAELRHMLDVKQVAQGVFLAGLILAGITFGMAAYLWRTNQRRVIYVGLWRGSLLTLGSIVMIVFLAFVAWDFFFNTFHALFFEPGTWRFYYSDTLIRLYPEQFWFDASLLIGGLTASAAALILFITTRRLFSQPGRTDDA
jgi:integral membrane protein (TIGR01906 family)